MSVQVHTSGQVTINGDAVLNVGSGSGDNPSTPVDLSGYVKKTELNSTVNNLQTQINNLGGGGLNVVEVGEFINCSSPSEGLIVSTGESIPIFGTSALFSLVLEQGKAIIFDMFLGIMVFENLPRKLSKMIEYNYHDFDDLNLFCNDKQSSFEINVLNETLSVDNIVDLAYKIYIDNYGITVEIINKSTQEVLLTRKKFIDFKSNAFVLGLISSTINPYQYHYVVV